MTNRNFLKFLLSLPLRLKRKKKKYRFVVGLCYFRNCLPQKVLG